ncbi:unnamed protein product [Urochloa humidicola]
MNPHPLSLAGQPLPPLPFAPAPQQQPHYPFAFAPHQGYLLHLAALLACTKLAPAAPIDAPPLLDPLPADEPELTPPAAPQDEDDTIPLAAPVAQKRQSSRLAALNTGKFVHSTAKAMQRKALLSNLAPCSSKLKTVVDKRNILNRNKIPLSTTDLRKMVAAAGLDPASANTIGTVPAAQE